MPLAIEEVLKETPKTEQFDSESMQSDRRSSMPNMGGAPSFQQMKEAHRVPVVEPYKFGARSPYEGQERMQYDGGAPVQQAYPPQDGYVPSAQQGYPQQGGYIPSPRQSYPQQDNYQPDYRPMTPQTTNNYGGQQWTWDRPMNDRDNRQGAYDRSDQSLYSYAAQEGYDRRGEFDTKLGTNVYYDRTQEKADAQVAAQGAVKRKLKMNKKAILIVSLYLAVVVAVITLIGVNAGKINSGKAVVPAAQVTAQQSLSEK